MQGGTPFAKRHQYWGRTAFERLSFESGDLMKFADADFDPYELLLPTSSAIPLVCDSPHSGTTYPADFLYSIAVSELRSAEDPSVHAWWQAIPSSTEDRRGGEKGVR